jgi:hypothetical protein
MPERERETRFVSPFWRRGYPFLIKAPKTAIERLRAFSATQTLSDVAAWRRTGVGIGMSVGWSIYATKEAIKLSLSGSFSPFRNRFECFKALWSAAILSNIPPAQFKGFSTRHVNTHSLWLAFPDHLFPRNVAGLVSLNKSRGANSDDVQDKAEFAKICLGHGLAAIPTVAAFRDGKLLPVSQPHSAERSSLYVKALRGKAGAEAKVWRFEEGKYISGEKSFTDRTALLDHLKSRDVIVQPVLSDCRALRDKGSQHLSCLRLVTVIDTKGAATPIAATLSLAIDADLITSHQGLPCKVELNDGIISAIYDVYQQQVVYYGGPNPAIFGLPLPCWDQAVRLACQAHERAFGSFLTLGWDIALTKHGAILIEANQGWEVSLHQVFQGPLGAGKLGPALDEALAG